MSHPPQPLSPKDFRRFFLASLTSELGQWINVSAITYLVLRADGIAALSLVQGIPMLAATLGAPFIGALADRWPARTLALTTQAGLALVAAACTLNPLPWPGYALAFVISVILLIAFSTAYARLLQLEAGVLDRAIGWISIASNAAKVASFVIGPYLAFHAGPRVFLLVALLHAASAALLAGLPRATRCARPHTSGGARPTGLRALLRHVAEGFAHIARSRRALQILGLQALVLVHCGVEEAVAMQIAAEHLRVAGPWVGTYPSLGYAGGMLAAALLSLSLIDSRRAIVGKLAAMSLIVALSAASLFWIDTAAPGYGMKLVEGSLVALVGLLCNIAIVLRAELALRGRLQAILLTCTGISVLAGKLISGALADLLSARDLYSGTGLCIAALIITSAGIARMRS